MSRATDPAFPVEGQQAHRIAAFETKGQPEMAYVARYNVAASGLTIREHFASMAMQGLCANSIPGVQHMPTALAIEAVEYADALIAELDNTRADRLQTLILAATPALAVLERELSDRKTSGNGEEFAELEQLVTNLREALP